MKGRALGRVAWRSAWISWLVAWTSYLPVPAWLEETLNWGTFAVFTMAVAALCVWAGWNFAALVPALLDREPEERLVRDGSLVTGRREDGRLVRAPYSPGGASALDALQRAYLAGKVSVNGRRYIGPPPWGSVTTETVYESHDGVRVIRETRIVEQRMLPSGPRVSKDECDLCGTPLDVAWCSPSVPYFCHGCERP